MEKFIGFKPSKMTSFRRTFADKNYPEKILDKAEELLSNVSNENVIMKLIPYKYWGLPRIVLAFLEETNGSKEEYACWADIYCKNNYALFNNLYPPYVKIEQEGEIYNI